jgi:peroxidase
LLSSFIDLTQVYGPNAGRTRELRTFQRGQLKTSQGPNGQSYLPTATDGACRNTDATVKCFAAGEGRTNENLALTSMHTLFLREHNRIASELSTRNPSWDDEKTFQTTRKILIAIMQHIVYNEYLPAVVGFNNAGLFDLVPLSTKSYYGGYNPSVCFKKKRNLLIQ